MEPGFITALAPFVLACALAMAAVRWSDNARAKHLCGIGAVACVFLTAALAGSGILGLVGMNVVQRICICMGIALLAFGLLYPTIERRAGLRERTTMPTKVMPIRFLASQIVGRRGDKDEYLLAARLHIFNDGEDGEVQFSAAEMLGLSVNDDVKRAENIVQTRALAEHSTDPIGKYRLQRGPAIFETPPLTVSKEEFELYFAGKRTFYFAGKMIVTTPGDTWKLPICGYSPGDPAVVLQCPD